jgi:hypothetical protein
MYVVLPMTTEGTLPREVTPSAAVALTSEGVRVTVSAACTNGTAVAIAKAAIMSDLTRDIVFSPEKKEVP